MLGSLLNFGVTQYRAKNFEQAAVLWEEGTQLVPSDDVYICWGNLGAALDELQRYGEAEAAYRKAIELNPNYATAYNNLGNLMGKDSTRYGEAEAAYRKAIELAPNDATAYNNLGLLLHEKLQRYGEAEAAYRKAIELNPSYPFAYSELGRLLRIENRLAEAIPLFEKSQGLNPRLIPLYHLAGIYKQLGYVAEAAGYAAAARTLIPLDAWYDLACIEAICGNKDLAFKNLACAVKERDFDRERAWQDPDLEWIRSEPRFEEIVGKRKSTGG